MLMNKPFENGMLLATIDPNQPPQPGFLNLYQDLHGGKYLPEISLDTE